MANNDEEPTYQGTWTPAECAYLEVLNTDFNDGVLGIKTGSSKRAFFAERLRCLPKRISKRMEGTGYDGRHKFADKKGAMDPQELETRKEHREKLRSEFLASREVLLRPYAQGRTAGSAFWRVSPSKASRKRKPKLGSSKTKKTMQADNVPILPNAPLAPDAGGHSNAPTPASQTVTPNGRVTVAPVAITRPVAFRSPLNTNSSGGGSLLMQQDRSLVSLLERHLQTCINEGQVAISQPLSGLGPSARPSGLASASAMDRGGLSQLRMERNSLASPHAPFTTLTRAQLQQQVSGPECVPQVALPSVATPLSPHATSGAVGGSSMGLALGPLRANSSLPPQSLTAITETLLGPRVTLAPTRPSLLHRQPLAAVNGTPATDIYRLLLSTRTTNPSSLW